MNKKYIQIESVSSDDFMDSLVERLTQRIKEELDCCNETDTASKEWLTTKEACEYFKVSQEPVLLKISIAPECLKEYSVCPSSSYLDRDVLRL